MGKILIGNILVGKVLGGNKRWAKYFVGNATGRQSTIDLLGYIFVLLAAAGMTSTLVDRRLPACRIAHEVLCPSFIAT